MKSYDIRWLLVLLANLLLIWLAGLANHHLAPYALSIYVCGLFVPYAALKLDYRHGFLATALSGLAFDALTPAPFGAHLVLLGFVHAVLLYGRRRFPRDEPIFATVVALLANLFLILALTTLVIGENPRPAGAWLRVFVDLIVSQLVIALVTPWFMGLNTALLARARLDPETGRRVEL
jgi:rod shape-determining protein MreD